MKPHQRLGFKTQAAALAELKRILNASPLNVPLAGADLELVLSALWLHRKYGLICGPGIAQVYVDRNALYPNRCFHVRRHDGTVTDFSYRACVVHKPRSAEVRSALRHAIEDQIRAWRATQPTPEVCALCNDPSASWHVDHYRFAFSVLAEAWLQVEGIDDTTLEMAPKLDRDCTHRLADATLTDRWRKWHGLALQQTDALRIICATCNLERGVGRD